MINFEYINNNKICYSDIGEGNVLVLIHGFMESIETWKYLIPKLSNNYRIIAIDLPGHGKSNLSNELLNIESYCETVLKLLQKLSIKKCFIVGHSMGGYVSLDFAENHIEMLSGLCLLHSVPFADSEEKKQARISTINRIINEEKELICKEHAEKLFANQNISKFKNEHKEVEEIAINTTGACITTALIAMKNRKDYSETLKKLTIPVLYISGKYDNFINQETVKNIEFPKNTKIVTLQNSGHAGMYEQSDEIVSAINMIFA